MEFEIELERIVIQHVFVQNKFYLLQNETRCRDN